MNIEATQPLENKQIFSNMDEFESFYFPQQVVRAKTPDPFKGLDGVSLSETILRDMVGTALTKGQ